MTMQITLAIELCDPTLESRDSTEKVATMAIPLSRRYILAPILISPRANTKIFFYTEDIHFANS